MIVRLTLNHTKERRSTNLEIFGFPANTAALIMQQSLSKANRLNDLDKAVLDHCRNKIPPGYEQWRIVSWEFISHGEKENERGGHKSKAA